METRTVCSDTSRILHSRAFPVSPLESLGGPGEGHILGELGILFLCLEDIETGGEETTWLKGTTKILQDPTAVSRSHNTGMWINPIPCTCSRAAGGQKIQEQVEPDIPELCGETPRGLR